MSITMSSRSNLPTPVLRHVVVPAHQVRERAGISAFFSGKSRSGPWDLPRECRVACVMGSVELDLREARIPEGESVIEVFVLLGSIEMLFPPGVRVVDDGDAFGGEFSFKPDWTIELPPDAPVVRIKGSCYLGSVEAQVRYPGEGSRDAKKRIKAAR